MSGWTGFALFKRNLSRLNLKEVNSLLWVLVSLGAPEPHLLRCKSVSYSMQQSAKNSSARLRTWLLKEHRVYVLRLFWTVI